MQTSSQRKNLFPFLLAMLLLVFGCGKTMFSGSSSTGTSKPASSSADSSKPVDPGFKVPADPTTASPKANPTPAFNIPDNVSPSPTASPSTAMTVLTGPTLLMTPNINVLSPLTSPTEQVFTFKDYPGVDADLSVVSTTPAIAFKGGTYPGQGGTCGARLLIGQSCTVVIIYTPSLVQGGHFAVDVKLLSPTSIRFIYQ